MRRAVLGLLLAVASLVLVAPAAQAHNVLVGTDPADGSTVAVVPETVTLTFDEPALAVGSQVVVTAPDGTTVSTGAPVLVDDTVSQAVTGELPAGPYTVVYRITSDDGHPIEGQLVFTASGATAYGVATPTVAPTESAAPSSTPSATPSTTSPAPSPSVTASATPAANEGRVSVPVLVGVAVALVAVGAVVALLLLRRRSGVPPTAPPSA